MPNVRKFMFDNDFDERSRTRKAIKKAAEAAAPPPPPPPTFSEADLAQAREEAHAAGRLAGLEESGAGVEAHATKALERIADDLAKLFERQRAAADDSRRGAVAVAATIAAKMFPALNRRGGLDEIADLVADTLDRLRDEPRVVVRVAPEQRAPLEARIAEMARNAGFEGKVTLLDAPDVPAGDCRLEWTDGGAERDSDTLWSDIDAIVERHLAEGGTRDDPLPERSIRGTNAAATPDATTEPTGDWNG